MTRIITTNIYSNQLLKLLLCCIFSFFVSFLFAQTNVTIENDYQDAIKKGDQYLSEEKFDKALYYFESASRLKPEENYPKTKIRVIKDQLDDQKTKNILFEVSITSAERWFKASEFKKAKIEYENALKINPTAQYPKDRLAQISKLWSDPEVDAAYAKAIMKADDLFSRESYQRAKAEYMTASDLKPHEQYPLDRILDINDILASRQALQQAYEELIRRADDHFDQNEYESARDNYSDASGLKPDEIYPKTRIREIEKILADLLTQREKYNKIIALADDYYINNDFEKAKIEYRKAASTMPGERYPGNMISKLDPLIEEQQTIQREYDLAISNAEKQIQAADYENAIASLQNANEIKPDENYPKEKITEINGLLAKIEAEKLRQQQLLAAEQQRQEQLALEEQQRQEQLLLEEQQRQEQLRIEQEKQQQAYDNAISVADQAFGDEDYQAALTSYAAASEIKPEEDYPKEKIAEINGILTQIEAEEQRQQQLLAEEQKRQQQQLLMEEQQRKEQLALEEQQRQKQLALEEQQRQEQLALEEQKRQEQLRIEQEKQQQAYDNAIAAADQAFSDEDYQAALTSYSTAGEIKPEENYPKDKIAEINGILAQIEAEELQQQQLLAAEQQRQEQLALEEQQRQEQLALEEQQRQEQLRIEQEKQQQELLVEQQQQKAYDDAIKEADRLFVERSYETAKSKYQLALGIKPEENYPRTRIRKLEELLAQKASAQRAYNNAITQGDTYLSEKKYQQAKSSFVEALTLFPDESYPKNKIDEINVAIQGNEVAKEKAYNNAVALADKYYSEEDYNNAKNQYQAAIKINPDESYPRERLKEVEKLIQVREMELTVAYQKAIAKADDLYNKKILDQAIQAYRDAKKIKPDETYPDNRINSIRVFIEEHAIVELVTSSVIIKNNSDEKYNFPPINIRFRKNNYILLKARIIGEDNAKVYLSYGQDGQKYGGIVLKSILRGEINDYIIRISAQDPWYRNDNNWLSIYSEGGDIEVTSLQISQGD